VKGAMEREEDGLPCSRLVEMPAGGAEARGKGGAVESAVAEAHLSHLGGSSLRCSWRTSSSQSGPR
jgi:hypothetical protein